MFPALGLAFVPGLASAIIAASFGAKAQGVLSACALIGFFAGILLVARYRALVELLKGKLDAINTTGAVIERERNAEHDRAERLQEQIDLNGAKIEALERRPDLETVVTSVAKIAVALERQAQVLSHIESVIIKEPGRRSSPPE